MRTTSFELAEDLQKMGQQAADLLQTQGRQGAGAATQAEGASANEPRTQIAALTQRRWSASAGANRPGMVDAGAISKPDTFGGDLASRRPERSKETDSFLCLGALDAELLTKVKQTELSVTPVISDVGTPEEK